MLRHFRSAQRYSVAKETACCLVTGTVFSTRTATLFAARLVSKDLTPNWT